MMCLPSARAGRIDAITMRPGRTGVKSRADATSTQGDAAHGVVCRMEALIGELPGLPTPRGSSRVEWDDEIDHA